MKKNLAAFLENARLKIKERQKDGDKSSITHVGPNPKNVLKKNKKTNIFPGQKTISEIHDMKQLQAESKIGDLKPSKAGIADHLQKPQIKPSAHAPSISSFKEPDNGSSKIKMPSKIVGWFKKKENLKKKDNLLDMKKDQKIEKSTNSLPENQSTAKLQGLNVPQPNPAPKQPKLIKGCDKIKKFLESKKGGKNG